MINWKKILYDANADTVICIDSNFAELLSTHFQNAMADSLALFLIISSADLLGLPSDLSNVFKFVEDSTEKHYYPQYFAD